MLNQIDRSARSQGERFACSYQRSLEQGDAAWSDQTKDGERSAGGDVKKNNTPPELRRAPYFDELSIVARSLLIGTELQLTSSSSSPSFLLLRLNGVFHSFFFSLFLLPSPSLSLFDETISCSTLPELQEEENKRESSFGRRETRERRSTRYLPSTFHRSNNARYLSFADLPDCLVDSDRAATTSIQRHRR